MTLEEKIGQMTQAERGAVAGDPQVIAELGLGSVLSGGGSTTPNTPAAWVAMVNEFQTQALGTRLGIPIIYGIDAVHGHGNVHGATIFPHNIGLGASQRPGPCRDGRPGHRGRGEGDRHPMELRAMPVRRPGRAMGRTYESFGEDSGTGHRMATIIDGLQGMGRAPIDSDHVLATAKHYAGDGDTEFDAASQRPTSACPGICSGTRLTRASR